MLLTSTTASDQPSLLVKTDGQQIIATKADVTLEEQKEQLTAIATDALHTKTDDLPLPHTDPTQFSELAVSPPANETLHAQGILGDAIETAILQAGSPTATEPVNASAGSPIADTNASTAHASTPVLPTLSSTTNRTSAETKKEDVGDATSALPIANINGPATSSSTPTLPQAPANTSVVSVEGVKQDETTKKSKLDLVSTHLEELTTADEKKDQTMDFDREPAEVVMELGVIDEEPENGEDVMAAVQTPEPVRKHHHRHGRKQEFGKWVSVGFLLLGGAITGVLVGVFIIRMLERFDLAPVVDLVPVVDMAPVIESVKRL